MTRMYQRILAGGNVGFFVFILITTAWDYCHPDPDKLLFKGSVTPAEHQIKKLHHPCASLKDAFDNLPLFRISQSPVSYVDLREVFVSTFNTHANDSFNRNGLSPPPESPPQLLPLFQLNCNLRI